MKTILINPPMDQEIALGRLKRISALTTMMPMGLAYIAAILQHQGYDVEIIDGYAESLSIKEIVERVLSKRCSLVGLSCVTPVIPTAHTLAMKLKREDRNLKICLGGCHPSIMPEETLKDENVDYVIRGEGELTVLSLVEAIEKGDSPEGISGLSYRHDGTIVHNTKRELVRDLDTIPYPAYNLLPMHLYTAPPHWQVATPAFQMMASRGCPFKCTFCGIKTQGKRVRQRSVKGVIDEMILLKNRYGAREIMFVDPIFPYGRDWAMEFCDSLISQRLHRQMVWVTETRVDRVDQTLLNRMYAAGCRVIGYGIESGVQELLNIAKKGFKLEQVEKAVKMTQRAGIRVYGSFILGLPGETVETARETIELAKRLNIDFPKFNLLVPYPGSEIYEQLLSEGLINSVDWEQYTSFSSMTNYDPAYVPSSISLEELKRIHKESYRSCYFRPRFILHHLTNIRSLNDIKNYLVVMRAFWEGIIRKRSQH